MPDLDSMSQWDKLQLDCKLSSAEVNYVLKRIRNSTQILEMQAKPAGGNLNYEIEHFYLKIIINDNNVCSIQISRFFLFTRQ